jgi:indoleamine 2,3-dioxygenase
LPPAIAAPFVAVSRKLDLPPVLAYSASNLWNFKSSTSDFWDLDAIHPIHTFTGTEDESWFLMISVAMEAKAGYGISAMMRAMEAAKTQDYAVVTQSLEALARSIVEVGDLLERMYEKCDPNVFFHQIRPFLAGSKNMGEAGLPKGVFYDEGNGQGQWMQLRGGSNGQSSLIQFWDVVLGVQHSNEGSINPHGNKGGRHKVPSFHEEVREYMPQPHRRLLQFVKETSGIRDLALKHSDGSPEHAQLHEQYISTVQTLTEFRNKHIRLVTRYIVLPSKQASALKRHNLAAASVAKNNHEQETELTGTGGTALMPFLKQSRDETLRTASVDQ